MTYRQCSRRFVGIGFVLLAACSSDEASNVPSPSASSTSTTSPSSTTAPSDASAPPVDGGGTTDATTTAEAGVDAAAPKTCANGNYLFCEDFDALATGPAQSSRWTNDVASGSLTVDATKAHAGKALKVHTDGNGRALMRVSGISPPGNSFYGRMYAWVTAFPSAPNYAHYTLVEAAGTGNSTLIRPVGGQYIMERGQKKMWGIGSDGGPTGDWTRWKESAVAEPQKWLCLEWQLDATDNTVRFWVDGVAKPEMTVSTKNHDGNQAQDFVFPKVDRIFFGWWLYQGGSSPASFDTWLDDIALSTTRIGC